MSISYLISLEQLSILAHFSGIEAFPTLPELPFVSRERCEELIPVMGDQGMLCLSGDEAAVDMALGFILDAIAKPALLIQTQEGSFAFCTKELGVFVGISPRNPSRYLVTPLSNATELADKIWDDERTVTDSVMFKICRDGNGWEEVHMTKPALEAIILSTYIYTEGTL